MSPEINWPNDVEAAKHHVSFDFILSLQVRMQEKGITVKDLADKVGLTEARVNQFFKSPRKMTLETMNDWALAVGLKLSVVVYDDGDLKHIPVFGETFNHLWITHGKPYSFNECEAIRKKCSDCVKGA
jgi:transcriptional regulator with XRE-family HTH domain